jgi:thiol:disulfide interchange protein DsbD
MFATVIWLLWILGEQSGSQGIVWALSVGLGALFVFWIANLLPGRWSSVAAIAGIALLVCAAGLSEIEKPNRRDDDLWRPWSPAAVAEARDAGHPVFVDFSAAWCVTCLVNEHVALQDPSVIEAFREARVVTLRADWTNRNAAIASELTAHGRAGVPLYLVYPTKAAGPPLVLPQTLNAATLVSIVRRIADGHIQN